MLFLAPQVGFEPTTLRFNSALLHTLRDQPATVKPLSQLHHKWCPQGLIVKNKKHDFYIMLFLAPQVGFEPTTLRLTAACSTAELLRNINGYCIILSNQKKIVNNFLHIFQKILTTFYVNLFIKLKSFL